MARGSARTIIPKLCAVLKRENPRYTNYDIREIIEKDCIHIWQKATIRDAFEDEYKDKQKQDAGRIGSEVRYGSGQSAEYGDSGETEQDSARKNLAENSSVGPVEDVSEDFSQMERHRRNN
jgi:hypothetical protein